MTTENLKLVQAWWEQMQNGIITPATLRERFAAVGAEVTADEDAELATMERWLATV